MYKLDRLYTHNTGWKYKYVKINVYNYLNIFISYVCLLSTCLKKSEIIKMWG